MMRPLSLVLRLVADEFLLLNWRIMADCGGFLRLSWRNMADFSC